MTDESKKEISDLPIRLCEFAEVTQARELLVQAETLLLGAPRIHYDVAEVVIAGVAAGQVAGALAVIGREPR